MRSKTITSHKSPKTQHLQNLSNPYENILAPSQQHHCQFCQTNITNYTYALISFKKKQNNSFSEKQIRACIHCFSNMGNIGDIGQYFILSKLDYLVYEEGWTAREELLLFEGLEKHGFENWGLISKHIDTKTPKEVEDHYKVYFLDKNGFMPDNSETVSRNQTNKKGSSQQLQLKKNRKNNIINIQKREMPKEQKQIEIQGYMPKRRDFQCEYDDDAELYLAEMEFTQEQTQEQLELKFQMIELYNKRVEERYLKTNFVCNRGLLDLKKQAEIDKKMDSQERDVRGMMRIFQRYLPADKYEKLIEGLLLEKKQKQKIKIYKDLSDKGIKSLLEAHKAFVYIYHKNHLNRDLRHRKDKLDALLPKQDPENQALTHPSQILSKKQTSLCKQLKLPGTHYLIIRETIIRELKKHQKIQVPQIYKIFNFNKETLDRILEFLHKEHMLIHDNQFIISC